MNRCLNCSSKRKKEHKQDGSQEAEQVFKFVIFLWCLLGATSIFFGGANFSLIFAYVKSIENFKLLELPLNIIQFFSYIT